MSYAFIDSVIFLIINLHSCKPEMSGGPQHTVNMGWTWRGHFYFLFSAFSETFFAAHVFASLRLFPEVPVC